MAPDPRLIERSGNIKQELVEFAQGPRFRGEFRRALHQRFGPRAVLAEEVAANFLDGFILEHRLQGGGTVLEQFVAARPELSEAERAMVLGWREVVRGPFRVDDRLGDTLIATNLVDELPYRIHSNMGGAALAPMKKGSYIVGRIVPVEDDWLLSGVHSLFPKSDRLEMESMAAALAEELPEAAFRNPAKLEAAWAEQRRDYEEFVDFFGSDTVIVPGRELCSRLEGYVRHKLAQPAEGIDELDGPDVGEMVDGLGPLPESLLPKDLRTAETVGILYDPTEGLWFVKDYGRVLDAFADPGHLQERRNRRAVHALLTSEDYPPFVIQRPAERDPEKASRVFQQVLNQPEFSWPHDGEALLRRSKPEFYTSPPLPGEASLIDDLMALATLSAALQLPLPPLALPSPGLPLFEEPLALPSLLQDEHDRPLVHVVHSVGRNDPCPCGSGRKYKRCCGA